MTRPARCALGGAICLFLAPAAYADIGAEDVWTDLRGYLQSFGYEVTGQQQRSGNQLVVSGVTMTMTELDEKGGATISLDQIILTEGGDGSVAIDMPAVVPMTIVAPDADGQLTRVSMDYRQTGFKAQASGTPAAITYTYSADRITVQTTGIEVNGQVLPPDQNEIDISVDTMAGTATSTQGSGHTYTQDTTAASVKYTINVLDPESQGRSNVQGQTQALAFSGRTELPFERGATGDINAMLGAGMTADGTFTYSANAATIAATTNGASSEAAILSGPGNIDFDMSRAGIRYDLRQQDMQVEIESAQAPLPISFSIAQSAFNMLMPLQKTDAAEPFALAILLDRLALSDTIWSLFDPSGQLPRDPATVALDLEGKARLLFDFLDPTDAANLSPDIAPAEIESVDVRQLQIAAAGAKLEGNGAFAFDNASAGPPKPSGALNLTLSGANGLIDRLIAAGLLPEEQAMGVRMMMGMFAVPGSSPDTMTSRIEVNEQGHVLANGQRIR